MNKKAQAQIITTVLIILLVLAAIVIVWQVVQSTIESGAETIEGTAACIGIDLEIVSANSTANSVTVTRLSGGDKGAVGDIRFLAAGSSVTTVTNPSTGSDLEPLETKTWTGFSPVLTTGQKVEVAAILSDGDGTICNIMDNILVE